MPHDCGCTGHPSLQRLGEAGRALTRRDALAAVGAAAGLLALGDLASAADQTPIGAADVIFHGGPIVTMVKDGERAARISPAKSALRRGMKFTLHHDAPVAGIGMLPVAAAAVNRTTTGGKLLGPEQRVTAFETLRAITHDAAWQYFQEDRKGTLEPGKVADLVILDADPLAIDPTKMAKITILETIKDGETVFRKH